MNRKNLTVKIEDLEPYSANSRTHSESQISQIIASISQFGFTNPILIDENKGIIAGHGRVTAASRLEMTEVPAVMLSGYSDDQKKALVILDNKLALNAGWDYDILGAEINDLDLCGFDIELLGFDEDELEDIMGNINSGVEFPEMRDGERDPFQTLSFTLHDSQVDELKRAMKIANDMGEYDITVNANGNGNALARVVECFITRVGDGES